MKKTFYQIGAMLLPLNLLRFTFVGIGIFVIVAGIAEGEGALAITVGFPWVLCWCFHYFADMYNRIVFTNEKVLITGQLFPAFCKRQFRDEVLYTDIANISLVRSTKGSKKKRVPNDRGGRSVGTIYTYMQFELKSGRKKWYGITFFSKRQRLQMLDILNQKTGLTRSYEQLLAQMDTRLK